MFDADAPLYGAEVKHQWLKSPTTVNMSDLMEPLVEVELVFTAKSDLSPEDSLEDLLNKLQLPLP